MIANSAFLAAMVLVLLVFFLMDQLAFLAPYKRLILHEYLWVIVWSLVAVFVNLFAHFYAVNRRLFLKDTGRKLAHVDRSCAFGRSIAGTCRNVHDKAMRPGIMMSGDHCSPMYAMKGANRIGAAEKPSEPPDKWADIASPLR